MKTKTTGIKLTLTGKEEDLIEEIVDRAMKLAKKVGLVYSKMDATMDLTACHANGNPLRLAELLAAKESDFSHDIFGIRRHLNRETGKLKCFFSPRYSGKAAK